MLKLLSLAAFVALLSRSVVLPVFSQILSCPAGFVNFNNVCVQQASSCPLNYVLQNGVCLPQQSTQPCPSGQVLSNGVCVQSCSIGAIVPAPAPVPCQTISPAPCFVICASPCASAYPQYPWPQGIVQTPCAPAAPCTQNPYPPGPPQVPCAPAAPCTQNPWPPGTPPVPCTPTAPCTQSPWPPGTSQNPPAAPCTQNPYPPGTPQNPLLPTTPQAPYPPTPPCTQNLYPPGTPQNPLLPTTPQAPYPPTPPCTQNPYPPGTPQNPVLPTTPQVPYPPTPPCTQNPYPPGTPQNPVLPTTPQVPYPPTPPCTQNPYPPGTPQNPCPPYTQTPLPPTTPTTSNPPNLPPTEPSSPNEGTTEFPPDSLTKKKCPPGTILVDDTCRSIYCKSGVFRDGRCVGVNCPSGTIWTGGSCKPEPDSLTTISWNTTIVAPTNNDSVVVLKNTNNLIVNATLELPADPTLIDNDYDDESELTRPKPGPRPTNCCTVMGPRICVAKDDSDGFQCYSNRYWQCGDICTASTLMLKPPSSPRRHENLLVMPPEVDFGNCAVAGDCAFPENYHDCSGCEHLKSESCSKYCYDYPCLSGGCALYDQRAYCEQYPGQGGCKPVDGCFERWCD